MLEEMMMKGKRRVKCFADAQGMRPGPMVLGLLGQESNETLDKIASRLLGEGDLETDIVCSVLGTTNPMRSDKVRKMVSKKVRELVKLMPEEMHENMIQAKANRLAQLALALLFLRRRNAVPEKFLAVLNNKEELK